MTGPTPPAAGPVPAPYFLRQLRTLGEWGDLDTPPDVRVEKVLEVAFKPLKVVQEDVAKLASEPPEAACSLFRVATEADFDRVVVGMCRNREKPQNGPFRFVRFALEELTAAGVDVCRVEEDLTGCYVANRALHYDATASVNGLRKLCLAAFAAGRDAVELRRPEVQAAHERLAKVGCPACPTKVHKAPGTCAALDCPPAAPPEAAP